MKELSLELEEEDLASTRRMKMCKEQVSKVYRLLLGIKASLYVFISDNIGGKLFPYSNNL